MANDELTIKLRRDYWEVDKYEPAVEEELTRLLNTDERESFQGAGKRTKLELKKDKVKATVAIHEDGPLFGMSIVDAVSIASGIASLVSLWIQLRAPKPSTTAATQDHYIVITNGDNAFRGKPGKKRLKQIVELMAKINQ